MNTSRSRSELLYAEALEHIVGGLTALHARSKPLVVVHLYL